MAGHFRLTVVFHIFVHFFEPHVLDRGVQQVPGKAVERLEFGRRDCAGTEIEENDKDEDYG
jgi:hypothetical protein